MLRFVIIILIFTVYSCKSTNIHSENIQKNIYNIATSKAERVASSESNIPKLTDENKPSINNTFNLNILNLEKVSSNLNSKIIQDSFLARNIEDLNTGKYQKVIDAISTYLMAEKQNSSKLTDDRIGTKPWRDIYLLQAIAFKEAGDETQAQAIFDKLIYYADNWEPIYLVLCENYLNKKAFALAHHVALRGIDKIENPTANIYIYNARALIGLNNLMLARKNLEHTESLYPNNSAVIGWLGVLDLKSNDIIEACKKFEKSYSLNKINSSISYNYASCLIQSQQYDLAMSVLKVGFFNANSEPGFYYLAGILENNRGKFLEAQLYWENYLKLASADDSRNNYVKASLSAIKQLE